MSNAKDAGQDAQYLRAVFDANPLCTYVVDTDMRIHDYNPAAAQMLGPEPKLALHRRGGDPLTCIHADARGCGHHEHCQDCILRNSVKEALDSGKMVRRIHKAELCTQDETMVIDLLVTATPLPGSQPPQVLLVLENVSELLTLRGLLLICAQCKRVRDDQQCWHGLETYLGTHINLNLTHGFCPTCFAEKMKEFEAEVQLHKSRKTVSPG
jgi:PAS domain-containing protein